MRKLFLLATIIAFLAMGLYGQEKETTQVEPKVHPVRDSVLKDKTFSNGVKLELVWEKEYEGPVFNFAISTDREGETYPNVVISFKAMIFNNKSMKMKEIKGVEQKYDNGKTGNIFRLSEYDNYIINLWGYASEEKVRESKAFIYDLSGKLLWKTENIAPNYFTHLAPNGEYFIGGTIENIIWGDKNGEIKTLINDPNEIYNGYSAFTEDSRFWALSLGQIGKPVQLIVFDSKGNELWRKIIEHDGLAGQVAISRNGRFVSVIDPEGGRFSPRFCFMFDINGNLLWKEQVEPTDYRISFSPNEDYILLCNDRGHIYLFELTDGNLKWNYKIPDSLYIYQDISTSIPAIPFAISNDGEYIVMGAREKITNIDQILIFSRDSGFISKFALGRSGSEILPLPKFSKSSGTLFVARGKHISKFALRGEK
ncbi:MAG: hypothetical protein ACUVTF_09710 [bacterium]